MSESVFVKCSSHRARQKLLAIIPDAIAHYDEDNFLRRHNHKGIYKIDMNQLESATQIKGVTKLRKQTGYVQCWH